MKSIRQTVAKLQPKPLKTFWEDPQSAYRPRPYYLLRVTRTTLFEEGSEATQLVRWSHIGPDLRVFGSYSRRTATLSIYKVRGLQFLSWSHYSGIVGMMGHENSCHIFINEAKRPSPCQQRLRHWTARIQTLSICLSLGLFWVCNPQHHQILKSSLSDPLEEKIFRQSVDIKLLWAILGIRINPLQKNCNKSKDLIWIFKVN